MEIFESHAHYDDEKFNTDRDEVIKSVYNSGVTKIISAGYSLEGSKRSLELAEKYPFIYSTVGISPNDINENYEQEIDEIDKILFNIFCEKETLEQKMQMRSEIKMEQNIQIRYECKHEENGKNEQKKIEKSNAEKSGVNQKEIVTNKVVAVGEIGLDYHYDTDKEKQKIAFVKQIQIANKYNLPIVIHTREAVMDTIQILKENKVNRRGVFHCCPFNRELVKEALKLGFYISFSGTTTFKNSKNAEEIVKMVPNDRFLVETDSPYLAPEPVRGTRNDSRNLKYIINKISAFKEETPETVAKQAYENTMRLYKISNALQNQALC